MAEAPLKLQVILIQTGDKIWTLGKRLLSKHENRVRKKNSTPWPRAHCAAHYKFLPTYSIKSIIIVKLQRVYLFVSCFTVLNRTVIVCKASRQITEKKIQLSERVDLKVFRNFQTPNTSGPGPGPWTSRQVRA